MKKLVLLAVSGVLWGVAMAQPPNNNCANAIALTVSAPCTNGTNVGANLEVNENIWAPSPSGCWLSAPSHTVWYTFTPTVTGTHVVSLDNPPGPDSQVRIFSGVCANVAAPMTELGCGEDDAGLRAIASATCNAGTTYYVQVDIYGATTAAFCINVFRAVPPTNDCVTNATDITTLITGLGPTNPYNCSYGHIYNVSGTTADDPTRQDVVGDPNSCNSWSTVPPYPLGSARAPHFDIWYKFTVPAGGLNAFLHMFPSGGDAILTMGLYRETTPGVAPIVAGGGCAFNRTGNITGLTFMDCSVGELLDPFGGLAPTYGGIRDKAKCSTPVHPRLDITLGAAAAGYTYYIRVWDFGGFSPPYNDSFNFCAERTPVDYPPSTSDACPSGPTIGYVGSDLNVDVNMTYIDLSNAGGAGNAYGGSGSISAVCGGYVSNEPRLGTPTPTDVRPGCSGGWISGTSGSINNIMNVSVVHSFIVNSCPGSEPTLILEFNNIASDGTPGNVPQIQVMAPGNCDNSFTTYMYYAGPGTCFQMRPPGNAAVPNGTYYIVIDGQDGQLIEYDLTLILDYPAAPVSSCVPILPVELLDFTAAVEGASIKTSWATGSESNNDHFTVERSKDGIMFTAVGTVAAGGRGSTRQEYTYFDTRPLPGLAYYRLAQVDLDGSITLSKVVAVLRSASGVAPVLIYPNPVRDVLTFVVNGHPAGYELVVHDPTGKTLRRYAGSSGTVFELDVRSLENGIYSYAIASTGERSVGRFVVQHD